METVIKKIIAKDCEREIIDSSIEEMERFEIEPNIEEFKDKNILCIKFVISDSEDFENAEETNWYINPYYIDTEIDSVIPQMSSEFIPELLLLHLSKNCIFEEYWNFYKYLLYNNLDALPDEEKYKRFIEWLEE